MLTPTRSRAAGRRTLTAIALTALAGLAMTACGGATGSPGMPGVRTVPHHSGMPGMSDMPTGDGLTADASGFRFVPVVSRLPAGQPVSFPFRILGAGGKPVTALEPDQTKLMHFYLIRSDLTGFQHVHPSMSTDGTWTASLAPAQPGTYRAYTSFIGKAPSGKLVPLVLSPPVTDLQPYLDTYARLTTGEIACQLWGSTGAAVRWCSRWCRVARVSGWVGHAARCLFMSGPFPRGLPPNRTCPLSRHPALQ